MYLILVSQLLYFFKRHILSILCRTDVAIIRILFFLGQIPPVTFRFDAYYGSAGFDFHGDVITYGKWK